MPEYMGGILQALQSSGYSGQPRQPGQQYGGVSSQYPYQNLANNLISGGSPMGGQSSLGSLSQTASNLVGGGPSNIYAPPGIPSIPIPPSSQSGKGGALQTLGMHPQSWYQQNMPELYEIISKRPFIGQNWGE